MSSKINESSHTNPFIISSAKEKNNKENIQTKNITQTQAQKKAIMGGKAAIEKYLETYTDTANKTEVCIDVLNATNASKTSIDWALEEFDLNNDAMKEFLYKRINKNNSKIAAAKLMKPEQLERLNDSSNAYVRQTIENIIEEDKKNHIA